MFALIEYGTDLFILFLFPLVGLGIDFLLSKKTKLYTLLVSILLLSPILTGWTYIINYTYQIFGLLTLGTAYSFYSGQIEKKAPKIITSVIVSGLLFLILGYFAFIDAFATNQRVEKKWEFENYRIEYVRYGGFSGRPVMKYELSKYSFIPIFIKHIETYIDDNTLDNCEIIFEKNEIIFNKCEVIIRE